MKVKEHVADLGMDGRIIKSLLVNFWYIVVIFLFLEHVSGL
jgi:hypothetical protein